jgi:hypothetical protein
MSGFPIRILNPARKLYRIHRNEKEPWWFCSDLECRFDLAPPTGTCYLAETPLGSFVEVFQDVTLIGEEDIAARGLSELHVPRRMRLADCTSPRARGFGCTGEIHTTTDYELTQRWAARFARERFNGVRYLVRHDPAQRQVGIALFGQTGVARGKVQPSAAPLDQELVAGVAQHFGIHVLPRP